MTREFCEGAQACKTAITAVPGTPQLLRRPLLSHSGGAPSQCESTNPQFCRSYYYTGKLLTENDLNREQQYVMNKLRLHPMRPYTDGELLRSDGASA